MFVKIVRHATNELQFRESIYECENFRLVGEIKGNPARNKFIILNPFKPSEDRIVLEIDAQNEEVYIMNNEGKTVDYYIWAEPPQEK